MNPMVRCLQQLSARVLTTAIRKYIWHCRCTTKWAHRYRLAAVSAKIEHRRREWCNSERGQGVERGNKHMYTVIAYPSNGMAHKMLPVSRKWCRIRIRSPIHREAIVVFLFQRIHTEMASIQAIAQPAVSQYSWEPNTHIKPCTRISQLQHALRMEIYHDYIFDLIICPENSGNVCVWIKPEGSTLTNSPISNPVPSLCLFFLFLSLNGISTYFEIKNSDSAPNVQ